MKNSNVDNNIIDFEKEKSPFVQQRREGKLKEIQNAFNQALPIHKTSAKKNKQSKKKSKKNKR